MLWDTCGLLIYLKTQLNFYRYCCSWFWYKFFIQNQLCMFCRYRFTSSIVNASCSVPPPSFSLFVVFICYFHFLKASLNLSDNPIASTLLSLFRSAWTRVPFAIGTFAYMFFQLYPLIASTQSFYLLILSHAALKTFWVLTSISGIGSTCHHDSSRRKGGQ